MSGATGTFRSMTHNVMDGTAQSSPAQATVASTISAYAPVGHELEAWGAVGPEVRRWVTAAAPGHRRRALQLLYAGAHLASWCVGQGIAVQASTCLRDATIERFCAVAEADGRYSSTTRATVRARLRYLAAANAVPGNRPAPPRLARGQVRPPYDADEVRSYLLLADSQGSAERRRRLRALLLLGLGAGCGPQDLRQLRGTDVVDSSGVWVLVGGPRPRRVPVLDAYAEALLALAAETGGRLMVGGWKPDRRSVTTVVLHRVEGGADLAPIEPGRLRSTWLTTHLRNGARLDVVMAAAGLRTPTSIVELARYLGPVPAEEAERCLRGRPSVPAAQRARG